MERRELFELWTENNDRPQWVREHREELGEYVTTSEPIPDGAASVAKWLDTYKATATAQLNPENHDDNDPEEDTE